jgi:hypothetical protein
MAITHTKVVAVADDGTSEVGTDEWNQAHTGDLPATSVTVTDSGGHWTGSTAEAVLQEIPDFYPSTKDTDHGSMWFDGGGGPQELPIGNEMDVLVMTGGEPAWLPKTFFTRMMFPGTTYTNNATLANVDLDSAMVVGNTGLETWEIQTTVNYNGGTTGDIQFAFTWSAVDVTTAFWYGNAFGTGASSDTNATKQLVTSTSGSGVSYGCAGTGTQLGATFRLFITATAVQSVILQCAQSVSNGTATTLTEAYMVGTRLA